MFNVFFRHRCSQWLIETEYDIAILNHSFDVWFQIYILFSSQAVCLRFIEECFPKESRFFERCNLRNLLDESHGFFLLGSFFFFFIRSHTFVFHQSQGFFFHRSHAFTFHRSNFAFFLVHPFFFFCCGYFFFVFSYFFSLRVHRLSLLQWCYFFLDHQIKHDTHQRKRGLFCEGRRIVYLYRVARPMQLTVLEGTQISKALSPLSQTFLL
mmetsp:Transcript_13555/g.29348  ORF Transcript_13555/g.29348 Transcript_13555/m.29348 type:complete len:210 (-) Transcript_13555:370-999(-)